MMIVESPAQKRELRTERLTTELVVVGGGLAGVCAAITAARAGTKVILVQDRPVLGGNASSEIRMWMVGATGHMANNNRWAREGGVINEIQLENLYRNPEGNSLIFDTILLEKVIEEPNIRLLLNTAAVDVMKADADTIAGIKAFCSQNSTTYEITARLFCDASGDGVLGFLAGAAFRMGAESADEFGEKLAPSAEYGHLLGHTIYFYSKDVGRPIKFIPPSFALKDITQIPRFRQFSDKVHGNYLWWVEYGGRLDTIHDTEAIRWELWRIVYGIWNYIKNSGEFPNAENLTLEWVGTIPGKRESRRFEGPYMLIQQDIVEQRHHEDAVAYGGWSIDLHPADGVYSKRPGCDQWHSRGVYQIPYRCMYSRNIRNLFLAGRLMSLSHVSFGSVRVMATLSHAAQAVGMAAALCIRDNLLPADLSEPERIKELQRALMRKGQYIPRFKLEDPSDLARQATLLASSVLRLEEMPSNGTTVRLEKARAQMLPVGAGRVPKVTFTVDVDQPTTLRLELRNSERQGNFTPDCTLASTEISLQAGQGQSVTADFDVKLFEQSYLFYCLMANEHVSVHVTDQRITGLLSVVKRGAQDASKFDSTEGTSEGAWFKDGQPSVEAIGAEAFEMWPPERRPKGNNLAIRIDPPLNAFDVSNITNGVARPTTGANAWVAALDDKSPTLTLHWSSPQMIAQLDLVFDPEHDNPLEHLLMLHPDRSIPYCVRHFRVKDANKRVLVERKENYQSQHTIIFDTPIETTELTIELLETNGPTPAALFEARCYAQPV